ncbi:GTPase-associated protein 1-related protein [Streptomyces sp. NPDC093105]|uniref:GTPase-associated protein 1-related protein n=1 Tax=Streptomyces sp. NPDC093105 TaxID=3366029 RepID=UPI0037FDB7F0
MARRGRARARDRAAHRRPARAAALGPVRRPRLHHAGRRLRRARQRGDRARRAGARRTGGAARRAGPGGRAPGRARTRRAGAAVLRLAVRGRDRARRLGRRRPDRQPQPVRPGRAPAAARPRPGARHAPAARARRAARLGRPRPPGARRGGRAGGGRGALPAADPAAPARRRGRLTDGLGEDVRAGLGTPGTPLPRTAGLLRIAATLGIDHDDLIPGLADRLCRRITDGATTTGSGTGAVPELLDVLDESAPLRIALLDLLEARAADHPAAVAAALRTARLPRDGLGHRPHLRMCAALDTSGARAGNRTPALHALLRASGGSHLVTPLLLRTAVSLLWQDRAPTAEEASQLLGESGAEVHQLAGTWNDLVSAAVDAPADDTAAPTLAKQLLRYGRDAVGRAAYHDLALLAHVHTMEHADTDPSAPHGNLVERARSLSSQARPAAQQRAAQALARLLLRADRPARELQALAYSNDPGLIDAYAEAARSPVLTDFLTVPSRLADCYLAWNLHQGAGPVWNLTRRTLLEEVLRPAARKMPDDQLRLAAEHVGRYGAAHRELFEEWARPAGGVKQLLRRIGGRRQERTREPRWGDVEPPRDGGR